MQDRFAFSDVCGWHVKGRDIGSVRSQIETLLDEELLPFIRSRCSKAPRPYGVNEFLVSLVMAEGERVLAHRELVLDLMKLEEGLEQVRWFFLSNVQREDLNLVVEVVSLGKMYASRLVGEEINA